MADAHAGLVCDALQRSRFADDNTLIIFAADHGEGMGHHGRILKNFLEEASWRVPTVVIPPGGNENEPCRLGCDSITMSHQCLAASC